MTFNLPPWLPERGPLRLALLGKLLEELGEATQIAARCVIQGVDERDPDTGAINRFELENEIADVFASAGLVLDYFMLSRVRVDDRVRRKRAHLEQWHEKLERRDVFGVDLAAGDSHSIYRCEVCDYTSSEPEFTREHIRKEHGIEPL